MTSPLSGPRIGETEWFEQKKRYTWQDEGTQTFMEVRVFYSNLNGQVTRATLENTSTKHDGLVIVTDKLDRVVFRQVVTAPHPFQEWDLSGLRVNVRGSDNSDKFSINLAARG